MITVLFDAWHVLLTQLSLSGMPRNSFKFRFVKGALGMALKIFSFYVIWVQEKGRLVRWVYFEQRKYDSASPTYNLFSGRSALIPAEQPHSIYYLDKFVQPTHLYSHSSIYDYPLTAKKENITSNKDWEHTVVVYEPFRTPMFAPKYIQQKFKDGLFNLTVPRSEFQGTDEEYHKHLPGHTIEKWHTEQFIQRLLYLTDEFFTPGAALP